MSRQPEQKVYDRFKAQSIGRLCLERIENVVGAGTPDLHCSNGVLEFWLELKQMDSFPARDSTPVLGADTIRASQKAWMNCWTSRGAIAFVLVKIGPEYYLVNGAKCWELTNEVFVDACLAVGMEKIIQYLKALR